MRKVISYIFICLCFVPLREQVFAYSLIQKTIDGHKISVFHIPHDHAYKVTAIASNTGTSLKSLIKEKNGVAGINGAYFTPKDYTGNADTTNTIRIMNFDGWKFSRYYPDTGINGIFGFLGDGVPIMMQNNIYGHKELRDNFNNTMLLEIESGIANFPILLAEGKNLVPRYDALGFITAKMKSISKKSFICKTAENDVKMGVINAISLIDVPAILEKMKCQDAINLDNGGSLVIYDKEKYIFGPGRNIMDGFIIAKK